MQAKTTRALSRRHRVCSRRDHCHAAGRGDGKSQRQAGTSRCNPVASRKLPQSGACRTAIGLARLAHVEERKKALFAVAATGCKSCGTRRRARIVSAHYGRAALSVPVIPSNAKHSRSSRSARQYKTPKATTEQPIFWLPAQFVPGWGNSQLLSRSCTSCLRPDSSGRYFNNFF